MFASHSLTSDIHTAITATMLIVDDDPGIANYISNIASHTGMHSICLQQSVHFPLYYSSDIDILLLDLFMPEVDGIELLQFIAKQPHKVDLIIMSDCGPTLLNSSKAFAQSLGLDVVATLPKPFNAEKLQQCLACVSNKHAAG